jgi:hypothetical protein
MALNNVNDFFEPRDGRMSLGIDFRMRLNAAPDSSASS